MPPRQACVEDDTITGFSEPDSAGVFMASSSIEQNLISTYPFTLTEDQEQLRREIRDFAAREIAPNVMRWDEASEFPVDVVKQLGQMGLMGVIFPVEYGGSGLGYVDYVLAIEELSAVDGSIGIIVAAHNSLGTNHIFLAGNEAQRRKYVPKLASGEWLGAWGLTEPGSGSDASAARTTAVRKGDNWVLNGNKTFITNAHYADVAVVIAVTDRTQGTHGLSAFVVEKGTPGFRPGKKENKLGLRASDTSELIFEDCEIPGENLLGNLGEGFIDAMRVLDGGRISIAALSLGIGRGALDASLKYVKERRQFGKAIAEFQGIQWKLADMATELDAARLLTQRAAVLKDSGQKVTRESSMAKLYASEVAVRICDEAVQLHGGYGFIKDYPAEKFYRDVKLCTIGEGTSEIQRMVIAREILKVHPSRG
jgi:alkylation response protein AidB-like acyl-CoA dehydrogenase